MVYLPTFSCFFYGKCVGEYTIHGSYGQASGTFRWFYNPQNYGTPVTPLLPKFAGFGWY